MAESVTFNNAVYIIPDVGESNWGQNLTNYFVAIPQGAYQASGGTMPLTADLSFGTNFGIFSKYITSVTANPASAGALRLAKTDAVEWRNNANGGNLALIIDSSDNLTFNGNIISGSGAGPVTSIAGTSNEITASAATGAVTLSVPSTFIAPGSIAATTTLAGTKVTLTNTTNQIVLGTTNTVTLSSTAPASSRTYTIPDAGGAANVVLDTGNYTIAGTWTFSNSITLASSKAIILTDNSTNTVTLKATNSTTSWTLNLPVNDGNSNQFLQTDGSGNTSWANGGSGTVTSGTAGNLTLYPATNASVNDTYVQNTHNITLGIAAQGSRSADLAYIIPNPGNAVTAATFALLNLAQAFTGINTFSAGAGAITLSGSTIAMGTGKITGLGDGTAPTDAPTFGQIHYFQMLSQSSSTPATSTNSTYVAAGPSVAITMSNSAHKIKVTISGSLAFSNLGTGSGGYTIKRDSTNLCSTTNGFGGINFGSATSSDSAAISYTLIDAPGDTSSHTYQVYINTFSGTGTVTYPSFSGTGSLAWIIVEEIG